MLKKVWNVYKVQIFLAIAMTVVLVAVELIKAPLGIALVAVASLLSIFTLDLDYIFYAYVIDPEKPFSQNFKGYIAHKDYAGALDFLQHNLDEVTDKTLNSAFFQILLAGITIMAVSSTSGLFVKAFIIGTFANSIYRYSNFYFDGRLKEWFWALKSTPSLAGAKVYAAIMVSVLIYSVYIL